MAVSYSNGNGTILLNDSGMVDDSVSALFTFHNWYNFYHGYLACVVCVFGVVANIFNIIVLTRKNMQSPTNVLLTGLAVSDGLTMAAYFPFALYFYVMEGKRTIHSARFLLFYAIFSVLVHSVSIWLTVTLALFRYIFIRYPRRGVILCSIHRAKLAIVIVSFAVIVVCLPTCLMYEVIPMTETSDQWVISIKRNSTLDNIIEKTNFWSQAVLIKLVPCFMLTVLSIMLVKTMKDAEKRRKKLLQKSHKTDDDSTRERKTNRTTRMLLAVVILFLLTETPQGVLHILSGTIEGFFDTVYYPLGDLLDILALINNGINFILYCTMSKQFRDTFLVIFFKATRVGGHHLVSTHMSTRESDL